MKTLLSILLILLFFIPSTFSQQPSELTLNLSPIVKRKWDEPLLHSLIGADGSIYTLRCYKDQIILEQLSSDFQVLKFTEKPWPMFDDTKLSFESCFSKNQNVLIIFSLLDEKKNSTKIFGLALDLEKLLFANEVQLISSFQYSNFPMSLNFPMRRGFIFSTSIDENWVLVSTEIYPESPVIATKSTQIDSILYNFAVVNLENHESWNNTVVLPYTSKSISISEMKVDNYGQIYLLVRQYRDESRHGSSLYGPAPFLYRLLTIDKGQILTDNPISLDNKHIPALGVYPKSNENILLSGVVETGEKKELFVANYNIDKTYNSISFKEIDSLSITLSNQTSQMLIKAPDFEKRRGIDRLDFRDKYRTADDGSILIFAEPIRAFSSHDNIVYTYGDILVIKANDAGNILWTQIVPKYQLQTTNTCSFVPICIDNDIYLLFNDHPKNLKRANPEGKERKKVHYTLNTYAMAVAKIEESGELSVSPLNSEIQLDNILDFGDALVNKGQILVRGGGNTRYQLGLISHQKK